MMKAMLKPELTWRMRPSPSRRWTAAACSCRAGGAGRIELDQRHGLHARPVGRLRPLGAEGRARVEPCRSAAVLPADGAHRARDDVPRPRRPAAGHQERRRVPAPRRAHAGATSAACRVTQDIHGATRKARLLPALTIEREAPQRRARPILKPAMQRPTWRCVTDALTRDRGRGRPRDRAWIRPAGRPGAQVRARERGDPLGAAPSTRRRCCSSRASARRRCCRASASRCPRPRPASAQPARALRAPARSSRQRRRSPSTTARLRPRCSARSRKW